MNTTEKILLLVLVLVSCAVYAELTGSLRMEIRHDYLSSDVGVTKDRVNTAMVGDFQTGGVHGSITEFYHATRTLASGASEILGLVGSLTNTIGETVTLTMVKGVAMQNTTAATATLTINSGSLGIGTFTLYPYGSASFVGSFTVGAGADRLTVTNSSGATATYRIWIVGN